MQNAHRIKKLPTNPASCKKKRKTDQVKKKSEATRIETEMRRRHNSRLACTVLKLISACISLKTEFAILLFKCVKDMTLFISISNPTFRLVANPTISESIFNQSALVENVTSQLWM